MLGKTKTYVVVMDPSMRNAVHLLEVVDVFDHLDQKHVDELRSRFPDLVSMDTLPRVLLGDRYTMEEGTARGEIRTDR